MIYLVLFVTLFAVAFITEHWQISDCHRKQILVSETVFLILMAGCRNVSVGIDSADGYQRYFNFIKLGKDLSSFVEPGWIWMNKIVIVIGGSYQAILMLTAILCTLPVAVLLYRHTQKYLLGMALYYGLYFYLQTYNLMRQCIAISFCLLAAAFLIDQNVWMSLLCMLLALSFHKTAIIFIAALLMLYIHTTWNGFFVLLIVTYFAGVVATPEVLAKLIPPSYQHYLLVEGTIFRDGGVLPYVFCAAVNGIFLLITWTDRTSIKSPWMRMLGMGMIVMNLTQHFSQGSRLVLYFTQIECIIFPDAVEVSSHKSSRIMKALLIIYAVAVFSKTLLDQRGFLMPYRLFT